MKTAEYIHTIDTKPFHVRDRDCADVNIKRFAFKVLEMGKKESLKEVNEILNNPLLTDEERLGDVIDYITDSIM